MDELNADPACTGYIVQLPLPPGLDAQRVLNLMDPAKDADGLHPLNLGRLVLGEPGPLPGTPEGIIVLLRRFGVPIAGAEVTVIGRGITVGRDAGPAADPAQRERHRDACATPAPRTWPRTPGPPTSCRGGGAARPADPGHGAAGRGCCGRGHDAY